MEKVAYEHSIYESVDNIGPIECCSLKIKVKQNSGSKWMKLHDMWILYWIKLIQRYIFRFF